MSATNGSSVPRRNHQPNGLPAAIVVDIYRGKVPIGTFTLPQAELLSERGNVHYAGGVRRGWTLPGDDSAAVLGELSFVANGATPLDPGPVHDSKRGNPTVRHRAAVALPVEGNGNGTTATVTYAVEVYATWLGDDKQFSLSIRAFRRPTSERQFTGEFKGLVVSLV